MKTLEELYKEIGSDDELKKEFVSSFKGGRTEEFLKAHDCDASAADVIALLRDIKDDIASEDDLAKVAGGDCTSVTCGQTSRANYQTLGCC